MPTRYDQLSDLYRRAHEQASKRRDAATELAGLLVRELESSLGVPEKLRANERTRINPQGLKDALARVTEAEAGLLDPGTPMPAIELCSVPERDDEPVHRIVPTPLTAAVTTEDGENYRFGIVMRLYSRSGFPPHPILFRVHMHHKLNDTFEVRPWVGADPGTYSAVGQQHQALSDFSDQIFNALNSYFTSAVRGEPRKQPIGFVMLTE